MKKILCLFYALILVITTVSCQKTPQNTLVNTCNHTDEDWIVATPETCTTAGLLLLQCDLCGEKTKIIPATGHDWVDASCTSSKICNLCKLEEGTPLGHSYKEKTLTDPTCTKEGKKNITCELCNDSYQESIPSKGHSNVLQSSGNDKGIDICSVCNHKSYTTKSISVLSKLFSSLKSPESATIKSIYAGKYTLDGIKYIVIVTTISAKNGYGNMITAEYASFINIDTNAITLDMVGYLNDMADYYEDEADRAFSKDVIYYLNKANDCLYKVVEVEDLISKKTSKLTKQDLSSIVEESKKISGAFD